MILQEAWPSMYLWQSFEPFDEPLVGSISAKFWRI